MKSALFSKLSLVPYLVVSGLSGCGDSGETSNGAQPQTVCPGPGTACPCPTGAPGYATCTDGVWGPCMCGGQPQGTGGFGNQPNPGAGGQIVGGPICGDGQITGGEQCDGQNHNQQSCSSMTMGACQAGYLICSASCVFEYTSCQCSAPPPGAGGSGGTFGTGGTVGVPPPPGGTTGQP